MKKSNPIYKKWWFWIVLVIVFVILIYTITYISQLPFFTGIYPDVIPVSADCSSAGQSADEYSFGKYIGPKKCCDGLIKIPKLFYDGECKQIPDTGTVCSNCGDNICDNWENICNCAKDCKKQI